MQRNKGLSQEWLKVIACVTMLIDHIGAVLFPAQMSLRVIGRIAFPIYCFLIAEGAHYTRNPRNYAVRMAVGAVLAEIPFDLALFGGITWEHQSVMLTLLLGFGAIYWMKKSIWVMPVCVIAAELLGTDYGAMGVLMILLFAVTREVPHRRLWQMAGMAALCWSGVRIGVGPAMVPVELFALLALIPIRLYSGKKSTNNRATQTAFYLFYPIHLMVLWLVSIL